MSSTTQEFLHLQLQDHCILFFMMLSQVVDCFQTFCFCTRLALLQDTTSRIHALVLSMETSGARDLSKVQKSWELTFQVQAFELPLSQIKKEWKILTLAS